MDESSAEEALRCAGAIIAGLIYYNHDKGLKAPVDILGTEVGRLVLFPRNDSERSLPFDEYSIVDIAWYPWTVILDKGYGAAEFLGLYQRYPNLNA